MIDLQQFCDPNRRGIETPFPDIEWTYATNGHIVIRVPWTPDFQPNPNAPNAKRIFPQEAPTYVPIKPFKLKTPKKRVCDICGGDGREHNCPSCTCVCQDCDGKGDIEKMTSVAVGHLYFQRKYMAMLFALPQLEISVPLPTDRIYFRFDGGEGVLMALQPHGVEVIAEIEELKGVSP